MATKKVVIDELDTGMTVADEVVDRSGRLLISTGEVIGKPHLDKLRCWGVSHVLVESEQVGDEESVIDIDADSLITARFTLNNTSEPPFPVLMAICEEQVAEGHAP